MAALGRNRNQNHNLGASGVPVVGGLDRLGDAMTHILNALLDFIVYAPAALVVAGCIFKVATARTE
jgi:hypothetical protein